MNFECRTCNISLNPTLETLKEKLWGIQVSINQCTCWGLSEETEKSVITELEAQKIEIKMQMHELINKL